MIYQIFVENELVGAYHDDVVSAYKVVEDHLEQNCSVLEIPEIDDMMFGFLEPKEYFFTPEDL